MNNEGNVYLRAKKAGCLIWGLLAFFIIVGILLIFVAVVSLIDSKDDEAFKKGIIGVVGGVLSLGFSAFFIGKIVVDYKKYKKGIKVPGNSGWDSGVLTDKIIRKHVKSGRKSKSVIYFSVGLFLAFIIGFVALVSEEPFKIDIKVIVLAVMSVVCIVLGIKELISQSARIEYHLEEDKVTFKENGTLTFLKYRDYKVDPTHFHSDMPAFQILEEIEEGEEMYLVYSNSNNRLIHIYRKKHWSLGDQ